jgi:hypothetical protein
MYFVKLLMTYIFPQKLDAKRADSDLSSLEILSYTPIMHVMVPYRTNSLHHSSSENSYAGLVVFLDKVVSEIVISGEFEGKLVMSPESIVD